jgi:AcrR family transcriptional regulator
MAEDDTRTRIVGASASHFARCGFDAASLRRIADDAGIKAASIFHHFPGGKRELYRAIMQEVADTIRLHIVGRYGNDAGLCAEDAVVQMAAAFWDYFADHRDYAKLLLHQASGLDRDLAKEIETYVRGVFEGAHAFLTRAQARGELGEFDVDHFMLWTAAHTLSLHGAQFLVSYVYPDEAGPRLRVRYLSMVRAQVRPTSARRSRSRVSR